MRRAIVAALLALLWIPAAGVASDGPYYVLGFGRCALEDPAPFQPKHMALDASGRVLVVFADGNLRRFTLEGDLLDEWETGAVSVTDTILSAALDVAVGPNGDIYVSDMIGPRVMVFDDDGTYKDSWGTYGQPFYDAYLLDVGPGGDLFVCDTGQYNSPALYRLTPGGTPVASTMLHDVGVPPLYMEHVEDMAIDDLGYVWIVLNSFYVTPSIQRYTPNLNFMNSFPVSNPSAIDIGPDRVARVCDDNGLETFTAMGVATSTWNPGWCNSLGSVCAEDTCVGQFWTMGSLALTDDGDMFIGDAFNSRIQRFSYQCERVFAERRTEQADPGAGPGAPVVYDFTWAHMSYAPGDTIYVSGSCDSLADWVVVDSLYVNGVAVAGNGGDKGLGFPLGAPVDSLFYSVPPVDVTDIVAAAGDSFVVHVSYARPTVFGNTSIYLLKKSLSSPVTGFDGVPAARAVALRAFPNPFNPSTTIEYNLPDAGPVTLEIYDVRGRRVATLADEPQGAGIHTASWNGTDTLGRRVASGVYFGRLTFQGGVHTAKLVLLE